MLQVPIHVFFTGVVDEREAQQAFAAAGTHEAALCEAFGLVGLTAPARKALVLRLAQSSLTTVAVVGASLRVRATFQLIVAAVQALRPLRPIDLGRFDDVRAARAWLDAERARRGADEGAAVLATLYFPWRSVPSSNSAALSTHAVAWAESRKLLASPLQKERLAAAEVGNVPGFVYPGAARPILELFAELYAWIFVQRELFDELASRGAAPLRSAVEELLAVLDGVDPSPDAPAAVHALKELLDRLVARAGAWWFARFRSSMQRYWLDGVLEDTRQRHRSESPSITAYLDVRMESICVYPALDLIEPAYEFTLDPEWIDNALIGEMRRLTAFTTALACDILACHESARLSDDRDIIGLLVRNQGRSRAEALAATIDARRELVAELEVVAAALGKRGPELKLYVECHRRWVRGVYAQPRQQRPTAASPRRHLAEVG